MAVIITNGTTTTASFSGYRVEAQNLYAGSDSTVTITTSATVPANFTTTFANAGNCLGIGLPIYSTGLNDRNLTVRLEENKGTCTTPIASPGIVTLASHGFSGGEQVRFLTTGTLPTGITAGTVYYVKYINANTFNIATTAGGTSINFTGSTSGTHTLWAIRINETFAGSTLLSNIASTSYVTPYVNFTFTTPYAVTTTASAWKFVFVQSGGTTGTWYLRTSDGTNPSYWTWCNTAVASITPGDTLIVKDSLTIDSDITLNGILGTGDTVNGIACIVCANKTDQTADNVSLLKWDDTPASSYTATFNGAVMLGTYSGFRVGTSTNRIPFAQQAKIVWGAPTVGTLIPCFRPPHASSTYCFGRSSLFMYGEIPTTPVRVTLAQDANTGQKDIVVTGDITGWANGDEVWVGKQDVQGQGITTTYTIASIAGQTITLNTNLLTNIRKSGGSVINANRFGITMSYAGATQSLSAVFNYNQLYLSGVYFAGTAFSEGANNSNMNVLDSNRGAKYVGDVLCKGLSTSCYCLFSTFIIPPAGYIFERIYGWRMFPSYVPSVLNSTYYKSGRAIVRNTVTLSGYSSGIGSPSTSSNYKMDIYDNIVENNRAASYPAIYIGGIDSTVDRNYVWGVANTGAQLGAYNIDKAINCTAEDNIAENCLCALSFAGSYSINCINSGFTSTNCTTDLSVIAGGLHDYRFHNADGVDTFDWTFLPDQTPGTNIKFTNFNETTNDDRGYLPFGYYQRTGDGLDDTTVHTSGTGKFAFRLQPSSSTDALTWSQSIPTGNIQNKDMVVEVWVKINSSAYWAGTNQMPRLTITYDDTSTAYAEAAQSTEWQKLFVPITPLTTTGSITATISGMTDALTTDAYIYFDDWSVFYPVDVTLDLGGMDDWSAAEPVAPTIATLLSGKSIANAVWDDMVSEHAIAGSFGEKVGKKLLTFAKWMGLK